MDDRASNSFETAESDSAKVKLPESVSYDAQGIEEARNATEFLTRADLDLAYSSHKLVNLGNLLMRALAWQNDVKSVVEYDDISPEFIEKAMEFDILSAILNSEVRELDNFMGSVHAVVINARHKITSCGKLNDLSSIVESKMHDTEESVRRSQDHILEMKMQLAKLQMTSLAFNQNEWSFNIGVDLSENSEVPGVYLKPQLQSVEQRHILRMLEKSLARELDLEKKLTEIKQNEEDIKLKLQLTEQVALFMEEAAEVIWGRFLEAENTSEVLMGISKEMVGRLQIARFNLDNAIQRESNLDSKLQYYIAQSNAKDNTMEKLSKKSAQLVAETAEAASLRERVKLLEEHLRESVSQLKAEKETNETSQVQLAEMDGIIESMRETIDEFEARAESAESKVTQLTETNSELTEELNFLKGSNDTNSKKVSLIEKQLRDLELQLQHSRASSEASQEQQNMLYTAIWDMETLIDELKQKAFKAENKTENAEEQCVVLSEANLELNKEVEFLKTRMESLETTLDQATVEKMASAKDINIKTNVIMDMVMQLAMERERINKQFYDLAKENKLLKEKLRKAKKAECFASCSNTDQKEEELPSLRVDLTATSCTLASHEKAAEFADYSIQVEETLKTASADHHEIESSISPEDSSNLVLKLEDVNVVNTGKTSRTYIFMAILVVLLPVLAAYFLNREQAIFNLIEV
ncbi:WPP domain-interacting tail-anchored protein 2-like [Coffea arabica]|uniref:WPP domain-interacting tail-anchored protein 2-like n=1 Tax=Coffea arabica TaxID=13443 RepID=A0ABM4W5X9_COFAR|nr:WPP domain-interacting tail-anchored protein 2-like [Coffea arabica]XP_027095577.1 WPP domain-interacting tail-anchored protein 2-like [Coffea arabica]